MSSLSKAQSAALSDYLKQKEKECGNCGASDWKFGEIQLPTPPVSFGNEKIEPSKEFVEVTCKSCGTTDTIDCDDAGLPPV
jgi:predicted nucleic-acid-binding Zn-ribbon protein